MNRIPRVELYAALLLTLLASTSAFAQSAASQSVNLPELSVAGSSAPSVGITPTPGENSGSVTVPSVAKQRAAVNATVGSVAFVDAKDFQDRYANTLRDVLKDVPGVYVQERYGQELRLSIRGSGIARGFHLRGIEVLQDGIPFNLADGSGDFYQIDPLALRSAEVYNLTDERYVSDIAVVNNARITVGGAAALAAFYSGNGRSVFAGVRASF